MRQRNQKAHLPHPEAHRLNLLWSTHRVMPVNQPGSISTWIVATTHAQGQTCTSCLWQDPNWPRRERRQSRRPSGRQSRKQEKRGRGRKRRRKRGRESGSAKEKQKERRRKCPAPLMKVALGSPSSLDQLT